MPNVNFTSSSIAQQDRFAQTTVSYESRNMQSIPFYPDVDHKAKFRGIFALTMIWAVIIGAVFGLLFGFRDVFFKAVEATPVAAWINGGDETSYVSDEEAVSFSLAAGTENPWNYLTPFDGEDGQGIYTFNYDGKNHSLPNWDSDSIYTGPGSNPYEIDFKVCAVGGTIDSAIYMESESDWPKDAGTYLVWIIAKDAEGNPYPIPNCSGRDFRYIEIRKYGDNNAPTLSVNNANLTLTYAPSQEVSIKNAVKFTDEYMAKLAELGLDYNNDTDIKFVVKYTADGKSAVELAPDAKIGAAGKYEISLIINANETNSNIEKKTFNNILTFEINKAHQYGSATVEGAFTTPDGEKFDGTVKEASFNKATLSQELKDYLDAAEIRFDYTGIGVQLVDSKPVNAGTYKVNVTIKHQNYNTVTFSKEFTIAKANLADYFDFDNLIGTKGISYTGKALLAGDTYLNISFTKENAKFFETIKISYTYEKGTYVAGTFTPAEDGLGIAPANMVGVGFYRINVTFLDANEQKNFDLSLLTESDTTRILEIKKADIALNTLTVSTFTKTYDKKAITKLNIQDYIKNLPEGAKIASIANAPKDAGTHKVTVKIDGGDNYNDTNVDVTVIISKASLGSGFIEYNAKQTVKKNGQKLLPSHSEIPEDYVVDYLINGKSIKDAGGVDRLGSYKIDILVSNNNYQGIYTVDFNIEFNPLSIIFGLVLGVVAGIIISLLIWLGYRKIEDVSYKAFKGVRLRLQHERGGDRGAIVCEGRVTIVNWNSEQEHRDFPWIIEPRFGRLFLTHATLEYYDSSCSGGNIKTYKNYRNFLIQIKEITGVEIRGAFFRSKLIVFARGARHVFYVEPNTAYLWRRDILHFRDLAHLYPMENNVVDNNYPFNYTLMETKGTDPSVPKNV